MKQILSLLVFVSIVADTDISRSPKYYTLKNEVIHIIDGTKGAMDGEAIWDIERVRWHMRRMHVGKLDKTTKEFTGIYDLDGQKYSINELSKKEKLAQDNNDSETLQKLDAIKNKAITEYIAFTATFLEKTKETKHLIIKLMEESCSLRNRMNSPILTWAETNGNEEEVFRKTNKDIQAMDLFFSHLNDFLGDLVASCPKGYSQFKKLLQGKRLF